MNHASLVERAAYSLKIAMIRLRSLWMPKEYAYAKARPDRSN